MKLISENAFEELFIEKLKQNFWSIQKDINRIGKNSVFDYDLLKTKIMEINNTSEVNAIKAINKIKLISDQAIESNIIGFKYLRDGVRVFDEVLQRNINIEIISKEVNQNSYVAIRQFEITNIIGGKRIPDILLFINGLPVIVIELKSPTANSSVHDAFKQNESLKVFSPSLWSFNVISIVSNQIVTKFGSITSNYKRFFSAGDWTDNENPIDRLLTREMVLSFIFKYEFFDNKSKIKYSPGLHQIRAVESTISKLKNAKDNRGGVIWHTQGSGKSVTMVMLARQILSNFNKATIIVVTDRKTLDRQLFSRFSEASEYLLSNPESVDSRKELIEKLNNKKAFGIYFTTVHKFNENTGVLSDRDDIFVLVDEAHRSQNNIDGQNVLSDTSKEYILKFGYARFMREAFPNSKLTGFTGTPLMGLEKETINIFGKYNDIYSMNDSVKDGSTVKIMYESRKVKINLNDKYLKEMDDIQKEYAKTLQSTDIQSKQKMDSLLKTIQGKIVLEDPDVILAKTRDILKHLEKRGSVLNGKAMIVATSRKAAFNYYKSIKELSPEIIDTVILVMTHNNKDSQNDSDLIVRKDKQVEVANEFRSNDSKYKVAIVVDMWLTGFDVPDLDVMYIDKVIKWHNLMQAIARVNRTFEYKGKVKESGLIVDYIGIWGYLSDAMIQYANGSEIGLDMIPEDIEIAKTKLIDLISVVEDNYFSNIVNFIELTPKEGYSFIMNSFDKILKMDAGEKNQFIKLSRKIKRLLKVSFTVINKEVSSSAKAIGIVNSLLSSSNTRDDELLIATKEKIKEAIEMAVNAKVAETEIKTTKINKDINQVAELLESEALQIAENNPTVASRMLADVINIKIKDISRTRPFFAKKASMKLKELLVKIDQEEEIDDLLTKLIELSKDMTNKSNEDVEYADPQMQAFFQVLSDDKHFERNMNSEALRKIAEELMIVSKRESAFGLKSLDAENILLWELKKILKNKYDYPPEELGGISGILVDKIKETIEFNPDYFVGKKEL